MLKPFVYSELKLGSKPRSIQGLPESLSELQWNGIGIFRSRVNQSVHTATDALCMFFVVERRNETRTCIETLIYTRFAKYYNNQKHTVAIKFILKILSIK